jgi:hypothetical protein
MVDELIPVSSPIEIIAPSARVLKVITELESKVFLFHKEFNITFLPMLIEEPDDSFALMGPNTDKLPE